MSAELVLIHNPPRKRDARGRFVGSGKGRANAPARLPYRVEGVRTRDRGNVIELAGKRKPTAWGVIDDQGVFSTYPLAERAKAEAEAARLNGRRMAQKQLAQENPPARAGIISRDVHQIRYRHQENGRNYYHTFQRNDVELIAMNDGTLRLRSRSGNPLWQNFPEGTE